MPRTQSRPTVTGEMSAKSTLSLAVVMLIIGVAVLALASPLAAAFGLLGIPICSPIYNVDKASYDL